MCNASRVFGSPFAAPSFPATEKLAEPASPNRPAPLAVSCAPAIAQSHPSAQGFPAAVPTASPNRSRSAKPCSMLPAVITVPLIAVSHRTDPELIWEKSWAFPMPRSRTLAQSLGTKPSTSSTLTRRSARCVSVSSRWCACSSRKLDLRWAPRVMTWKMAPAYSIRRGRGIGAFLSCGGVQEELDSRRDCCQLWNLGYEN